MREIYKGLSAEKTRTTTYLKHSDICANCGNYGGGHYTSDGVSWCYSLADRNKHDPKKHPEYFTHFSYVKQDVHGQDFRKSIRNSNPNIEFKIAKSIEFESSIKLETEKKVMSGTRLQCKPHSHVDNAVGHYVNHGDLLYANWYTSSSTCEPSEDRSFLDGPRNEGGQDNGNEQR